MLSVDEERALRRRGLILQREILRHELACAIDDGDVHRDSPCDDLTARIEMINIKLHIMTEVDKIIQAARI
jgi:hypothetical protein